jgi:phosphate transport system substrate-binding protein
MFLQALCLAPAGAHHVLQVGGTGGALATMRLLSLSFEKENPGVDVRVLPSMGSTGAIRAVSRGALHVGLLSRPLKDEERATGLVLMTYAKTPFVVVTHSGVDVKAVTTDDLVKILSGERTTWPNGKRIRLILRPETDSDTEYLRGISPLVASALEKAFLRPGMLIAMTDQECLDMIERTPGAIGVSSLAQVVSEERRVNVLAYDGRSPTVHGRASGSYRPMKQFSIVTRADPDPLAEKFISFVLSEKGRKILESAGSIPLKGSPD